MINVIVELSKYIILTLMIVYTFHCFYTVRQSDEEDRNELLRQQLLLIFFIDFTEFLVLYLKTFNFKIVEFYAEMLLFFAAIQILYRMLYKKASILLLNNMCMLLSVGFIMLCRLDISSAQKQLLIAAGVSAIALVIPVMIRKMRFLRRLTWVYAIRSDQDYFCVLYGIFSIQRYQFQGNRSGYSRCSTSRGYSGSLKGPWKCSDLLCRISRYGICCNTKCWLSCTWNRRWFSCSSCCISSVRSCPPASQRMERSYGSLSE